MNCVYQTENEGESYLINCTSNKENLYSFDISVPQTFIITANKGYDFSQSTPPIMNYSAMVNYRFMEGSVELSKDSDSVYKLEGWLFPFQSNCRACYCYIEGVANSVTQISEDFGTSQLYLLSNDNLKQLGAERYTDDNADLGQYIISLMKLYINIDDSFLTSDTLKLYRYSLTDIACNTISITNLSIDCGIISIPDLINGDYMLRLFLPFYGIEDISEYKDYMSNKSIQLIYFVNIPNGETLIKAVCENLVLYYNCNVGFNIPFFLNTYNNPDINKSFSSTYYFLDKEYTPYLHIIPKKTYELEIDGITYGELEKLKRLLSDGVIQ